MNSLLDDGSNEEIHELTAEKIRIEDLIDLLHNQIDNITNGEDNPFSIKKLEKQLSDLQKYDINTNDAEQKRFAKRLAVLGVLRESFKSSEVTFMEKMRKSLDAQMTSQFKQLVTDENEKRFFHELKTQDDWSVTCGRLMADISQLKIQGTCCEVHSLTLDR